MIKDTPWHVVSLSRCNSRPASRTNSRPNSAGRSTVRNCERASDGDSDTLRQLVEGVKNLDTDDYATGRRDAFLKRSRSDNGRAGAEDAPHETAPRNISHAVAKLLAASDSESSAGSATSSGCLSARRLSSTDTLTEVTTFERRLFRSRSLTGVAAVGRNTGDEGEGRRAVTTTTTACIGPRLSPPSSASSQSTTHAPLRSASARMSSSEWQTEVIGGGGVVPSVADLRRATLERANSMEGTGRVSSAFLARPPLPLSRSNSRNSSSCGVGPTSPISSPSTPTAASPSDAGPVSARRESRLRGGTTSGISERMTPTGLSEGVASQAAGRMLASSSVFASGGRRGGGDESGACLKKCSSDFLLSSGDRVSGERESDRQSQMAKLKSRWAETKAKYQRAAMGRVKGKAVTSSVVTTVGSAVAGGEGIEQVQAAVLHAELASIECEMRQLSRKHP